MAWTTISKTPLVWKMTEDASAAGAPGGYSDVIQTEGYDMALFIASGLPLKVQMKYDSDANGSQDAWVNLPLDTAVHKASTTSAMGFLRAPIPTMMRLRDIDASPADIGNAYIELRRTASWDRGN